MSAKPDAAKRGTTLATQSYSAFGRRRGSTWAGVPSAADMSAAAATTRDGYTGHEMLDNVALVHMNGRVYDPAIGRFLSADPFVINRLRSFEVREWTLMEGSFGVKVNFSDQSLDIA